MVNKKEIQKTEKEEIGMMWKLLALFLAVPVLLKSAIIWWNYLKLPSPDYVLISGYLEILSWPIIMLVFVFLFKNPISLLISKIFKIGPTGIEIGEGQSQKVPEQEEVTDDKEGDDIEVLKKEKMELSWNLFYERVYRTILESQIDALKLLRNVKKANGMDVDILRDWYIGVQNIYKPQLDKFYFDQFVQYLTSSTLVVLSGDKYQITETGLNFLTYTETRGYPSKRF